MVRWLVGPRAALAALVACALVAAGALLATWWFGRGMDDDGSLASEVGLASTGAWEVSGGAGSSGGGDVARLAGVGDGVRAGVPTSAQLAVHVAGAVSRPGLVRLWAGARVDDAVRSAGGVLPGADVGRVNLARRLNDGEQVYVPRVGEEFVGVDPVGSQNSGPDPPGSSLVNINTADASTLETLPGIGPVLAGRILDYREENGPFPDVEALSGVSGIGPAVLAKLRPQVTVS